jgi:hypothetical protein
MSDTEKPTSFVPGVTAGRKQRRYNAQFTTAQTRNALRLGTANTRGGTRKRSRTGIVFTDFQQKVVPVKRRLIAAVLLG